MNIEKISRREFLIGAGLAIIAAGCKRAEEKLPVVAMEPSIIPEPTLFPTEKPTETSQPTGTSTRVPAPSPSSTETSTPTTTFTATPTETSTPTPTITPEPSPTSKPIPTRTISACELHTQCLDNFKNPASGEYEVAFPLDPQLMESHCTLRPVKDQALVFCLPSGTKVYSSISGKVRITGGYDTENTHNIQVLNTSLGDISYIVVGRILVEDGALVTEGQLIAELIEQKGPCFVNQGNIGIWLFLANGNVLEDWSKIKFR